MKTTPSLTKCEPGAVVLVRFRFAGQNGSKTRPAVILSVNNYHDSRIDAVMMALTTQTANEFFGDCDLKDWAEAGLPAATKSKGVIQTIEQRSIQKRIGTLSAGDFQRVLESVKEIFGMNDVGEEGQLT